MPESTKNDPTDRGTKRPNAPPLSKKGKVFKPIDLPDFSFDIDLPDDVSPDDPISLFEIYYTPEIIDKIVQHTNQYERTPKDPSKPYCRAHNWYPTCPAEIYTYLAIHIYMTLHIDNEIADYWNTSDTTPSHPITKYITRD